MVSDTAIVKFPNGLHARVSMGAVKVAKGFKSSVKINGKDAKSIVSVMGLRAEEKSKVSLSAEGEDEVAALAAMKKYFA